MGWLFHCNIGTLRKHKLPLPCFLLPSGNYLIVKACSKSLASAATPVCSEKISPEVPVEFSFPGIPLLFGKEKLAKCS